MASAEDSRPEPIDDELFESVVAGARVLWELDVSRAEVWTSGAFSLWRDPELGVDAELVDRRFVDHLLGDGSPAAVALLVAASALDDSVATPALAAAAAGDPAGRPAWSNVVGTAAADRAWELRRGEAVSVAIDFHHDDGTTHSMLVELVDEQVEGIVFGPEVTELLAGDEDDRVTALPVAVGDAAARIAVAWQRCAEAGGTDADTVVLNQLLARRRLAALGQPELPSILGQPRPVPRPVFDLDADMAASRTLAVAIGAEPFVPDGEEGRVAACAELVRWPPETRLGRRQLDALAALEWADWLGAVIGLVRTGAGTQVDGGSLVDHVNRCPEVTSAIPKTERDYYTAAFDIVIERWAELGLLDGAGAATEAAMVVLPAALDAAWHLSEREAGWSSQLG